MNSILEQMLEKYTPITTQDKTNAIKEIMQEVVLNALYKAGFFKKVAFYGGTALRIFYGLNRFSEDLDFSLIEPNPNFNLQTYFPIIEKEIKSLGLDFEINEKTKSTETAIKSAFLKGNTQQLIISFYNNAEYTKNIAKNNTIKIKFEIDTCPPPYANFEQKYKLLPSPYQVTVYDMPSLFAGKLHAVICRSWKNRIKGRDLYDYIFYLSKNTKVNLAHLKARLVQTNNINNDFILDKNSLINLLNEKFENIDFEEAKKDVVSFIHNKNELDLWNVDFFKQITQNIQVSE